MKKTTSETKRIDWMITLVPLLLIVGLCVVFMLLPEQAGAVLSQVRFFFGDTFGVYYLIIGLFPSILPPPNTAILCWASPMKSPSILFLYGAP